MGVMIEYTSPGSQNGYTWVGGRLNVGVRVGHTSSKISQIIITLYELI